jgi:hypothetical protein
MKHLFISLMLTCLLLITSCDIFDMTNLEQRKADPNYVQRVDKFGPNTPTNFEVIIPEHRIIVRQDFENVGFFFFHDSRDGLPTVITHSLLDFDVTGHEYGHMILYNFYGKEVYDKLMKEGKLYK